MPGFWAALLATVALARPLAAQADTVTPGLPAYQPINPMTASRTALYFQPYIDAGPGKWHVTTILDYASMTEYDASTQKVYYVLDAEELRAGARVAYDVSPDIFVLGELTVGGAYNGFLDKLIVGYHDIFGFPTPQRQRDLPNQFLYSVTTTDQRVSFQRQPGNLWLNDARLGVGWRSSGNAQTLLTVTLPTATSPVGYGHGVVAVGVIETWRAHPYRRVTVEGSFGIGYTPTQGDLKEYQQQLMVSGSAGGRWNFAGAWSAYGNLFYHAPYYASTGLPSLDLDEWSLDFGFLVKPKRGPEWHFGMTEDVKPSGPAIDVVFRIGARL